MRTVGACLPSTHTYPNIEFHLSSPHQLKMDLKSVASDVDVQDADTPDSWVPREPRMIRLVRFTTIEEGWGHA